MPHPIEALMKTAMENIQQMLMVETIVGDPVEVQDGSVIIPISKVACGFAAGGSEFPTLDDKGQTGFGGSSGDSTGSGLPFGGGSGAGVSVQPVGFLVVGNGSIRLLPVDGNASAIVDRLIDTVPDMMERIVESCRKRKKRSDDIIITHD